MPVSADTYWLFSWYLPCSDRALALPGSPLPTDAPNLPLPSLYPYQESTYHGFFARSAGIYYREPLSQIASSKDLAGEPIAADTPEAPKPVLSWETGAGKSYLVPALEIPGFILLLNGYDRLAYPNEVEGGKKVYDSTLSTFWDHLVHGPWGFDQDTFDMNQFMHPYQGSIYPWIRAIGRPQLLGVVRLYLRGQFSLGDGRRDHVAFHQ